MYINIIYTNKNKEIKKNMISIKTIKKKKKNLNFFL